MTFIVDSASSTMEAIAFFHDYVMFFLIFIVLFVFTFLLALVTVGNPNITHYNLLDTTAKEIFMINRSVLEYRIFAGALYELDMVISDGMEELDRGAEGEMDFNTKLEIAWTVFPSLVLFLISLPSFALLYGMEEAVDPSITIKAIGHQWYWSYEFNEFDQVRRLFDCFDELDMFEFFLPYPKANSYAFSSFMIPTEELAFGELRLLEVDNPLVLPTMTHIRILVTADDVLHSWALPSFGIKIDAVPGRLNQVNVFIKRQGTFYGQCSELCGINHGFMPIVVKAVDFDTWVNHMFGKKLGI